MIDSANNTLTLHLGNIVECEVDAIVSAANNLLMSGSGVNGAIHRAAGPELLQECQTLGGCPTGEARLTRGYRLKSPWVIHTVGPRWYGGSREESKVLAHCYQSCLAIAREYGLKRLAFPSISTGAYRFPVDLAADIALKTLRQGLREGYAQEIQIILFDQDTYDTYQRIWAELEGSLL